MASDSLSFGPKARENGHRRKERIPMREIGNAPWVIMPKGDDAFTQYATETEIAAWQAERGWMIPETDTGEDEGCSWMTADGEML